MVQHYAGGYVWGCAIVDMKQVVLGESWCRSKQRLFRHVNSFKQWSDASSLGMELLWRQIRLLLMHEWRVEENAGEAARKISGAWDDDTVTQKTIRKCFEKFKAGPQCAVK
ncbi:hypothetical protein KIN20_001586 [Parelaphostrongylus tenuis]|uniref:Mos1 transposase HTH domain-containing protein n=1 Tax=Parelaphostrongylus tenuis TaxID=148309 RepID=A0AAD5LYJ6_PARTN|nr:hypothetical protein KIN20_001586 [Parelaphostrongylus tenuis]